MSRIVTYVVLEVPSFNSPPATEFFTFTTADVLTEDLAGTGNIPSLKTIQITPATISLGQDLGQRATVTATFKDHKHVFGSESYDSGTFWGKWRARYGLTLRGSTMSVIYSDDPTVQGETRTYIIDSTDGPNADGEYKVIAKDVLKLADGDRAQAPVLSNGFLTANITNVATSFTLSPAGVGAEYPSGSPTNFYVNVGGNEAMLVTNKAGDTLTVTRGQLNTTAIAHTAQDRVQLVLSYTADGPDVIINDLLVNYASVPQSYISTTNWATEVAAYLNTVYTGHIAEPTSVNKLISELIEQAGLVVWWDEVNSQIRLQVLRAIATSADTFDGDNMIAGSLEVSEQPNKRLSQVYTYFGKINPTVKEDQIDNYRSTAFAQDAAADVDFGSPSIKKIFSRWIPEGARTVADTLNDILLARFTTPPRRIGFDVLRGSVTAPALGTGYQIGGWPFQDTTGAAVLVPAQITRLNPRADIFEVEAEEVIFTGITAPSSPDVHTVIIDGNTFDVNLRTMHDSFYTAAVSGQTVECTISEGVIVGSTSSSTPAFDVGSWAAGVTVNVIVIGRIQGHGGAGGAGAVGTGSPGVAGGTALYTRFAINLTSTSGEIWGGGGGGGAGFISPFSPGPGGGGGAGSQPGAGGDAFGTTIDGQAGTSETGGAGGGGGGTPGGTGGGPGLVGGAGATSGGAAGAAIDGDSFVTDIGGVGDLRGGQIN